MWSRPLTLFVTEWAARGDLHRVLHSKPPPIFRRMQLALDAARGLAYLHDKGVVHRDVRCDHQRCGLTGVQIKSLNFLVTVDWVVKASLR